MNFQLVNNNLKTEYEELWEFKLKPPYLVLLNKNGGVICKPTDPDKLSAIITGKNIKPTTVVVLGAIKDLDDANSFINNIEIVESGTLEDNFIPEAE